MTQSKGRVFIIDDNPTNLDVLSDYLDSCGFHIMIAQNGKSALRRIKHAQPDIILLDVMMPEMDGYEVCQKLKENEATKGIPIIFMTALSESMNKVKAFSLGAVDYITKPFQQEEVFARLTTHLTIHELQHNLEQKVVERTQELEEANIKLQELNTLKSHFLTSMSHELRTPLNSILGFADLVLLGVSGNMDDQVRKDVQLIYNSGQHLLAIINDILDISKIEAGMIELVQESLDVSEIIDDVLAGVSLTIQDKPIELVVDIDSTMPNIFVDKTRLKQILFNLMNNAIAFTNEGSITIRVKRHTEETNMALITVQDTGVGIPKEKQALIFEQFQQVDMSKVREHGGVGLGLTIAQQLVDLHGGKIWVESEDGHGTTMRFTVPLKNNS